MAAPHAAGCFRGTLPVLSILLAAAGPVAPGQPPAAHPPTTSDRHIETLEADLLHAPDPDHADAVALRLAEARMQALSPTTRLMIRRAQRELGDNHAGDALSDASEAIALEPDRAILWRERASIQGALGNSDAAVSDLGGALSRDPADVESWAGLSEVAEKTGRYRQAVEAWQRVMQLSPMTRDGATRLRLLKHKAAGDPT